MSQRFFFLILFFILKISVQLDCSSLSGATCGGHNTKYNLICHQFGTGSCTEVEIDDGCTVKENHNCEKTDTSSTSYQCYFYGTNKNLCKRTNIDSGCKLTVTNGNPKCEKDNVQDDEDCFLSSDSKACEKKKKACNLYFDYNCGGLKGIKDKKQCAVLYTGYCKEITIDDNCQIDTFGECEKKEGVTIDSDKICRMNSDETECTLQKKECSEYGTNSCSTYGDTCRKVKYNSYSTQCKIINTINENCEINNDGECVKKSDKTINDNQKCAYNSKYTACEVTNKQCSDYTTQETCSAVQNCYFDSDRGECFKILTDDYCEVVSREDCSKKSTANLNDDEICGYYTDDEKNIRCEKRYKQCSKYDDKEKCNNAPEHDGHKCFYKSSECKEYYTDGYCSLNSQGVCAENGSGKLSSDEKCFSVDYSGSIICLKMKKECSDFTGSDCGNFTPEVKLCFNFEGSGSNCKEVKVDSQCAMNNNNECTGENCQFDEEKDRCYYQDNGSLVKMEYYILLMIFFML